jgi:acetolactate synthase-1/2/3 large subunit
MRLTGGQILAHYLVREGVPYVVGIPGHGCWAIVDALVDFSDRLTTLQVMHEQSAIHLADGYYRVKGRPLMAFTSIGPGATNTAVGIATAYVDSTAVMLVTGSPHTYMRGRAVLQEIERTQWANFPRMMEPIVKRYWQVSRVDQLPYVVHRAFNQMLSGRPGPVLIDMPMDVQADDADVTIPEPASHEPQGRPRPDTTSVERAARLLAEARQPVLLVGGGVITADASAELVALAEHLGAPVVTTWMGKGAIPEDHDLNAWSVGDTASTCGNALARSADVLLAVGCRFTDWSASSYRRDVTFSIPPTRLIHVDIDPHEIGKNYPCEIGLVADARAALVDLLEAVREVTPARDYHESSYFQDIQRLKEEWEETQSPRRNSDAVPMTQSRAVWELRAALDRSAIVVTGAGLVQGDGDFLQTMQEMAVAAMLDMPVLFVVLNNAGWMSIKGGQLAYFGRTFITEFQHRDGSLYTPDFAAAARSFGLHAERVDQPDEVAPAVRRALATGGPALVEVTVAREFPDAGATKTGWWDVPIPTYHRERRRQYEAQRAEEQTS